MAPRTAGKKAAAKTAAPAPVVAANVVDQAESADRGVGRRRSLKRRSTEEEADKAVKDNFKNISEHDRRMTFDANGLNVYDRVLMVKRAKKTHASQVPIGKKYYTELREELFSHLSPMNSFPAAPSTDLEDSVLFGVLKKLLQHNREYTPCLTYLSTAPKFNTLNLQALLGGTLSILPGGKANESTEFILEVMSFVRKGGYDTSHESSVKPCRTHFDQALVKDLAFFRSHDRSAAEWWEKRSYVAALVLPEQAIARVLAPKVQVSDVLAQIELVFASSEVGKSLVRKARREAHHERFIGIVQRTVKKLEGVNLTAEELTENQKTFIEAVEEEDGRVTDTFKARDRNFCYLGVPIVLPVTSLLEHYKYEVQCLVRTVAVMTEKLPSLWCEVDLAEPGMAKPSGTVDATLLKDTGAARAACRDFMAGLDPTANNIQAVFEKKATFLVSLDRSFRIEIQFFQTSMGELGVKRVRDLILKNLPTVLQPVELAPALASLEGLESSGLLGFVGMGARSLFTSIKCMLKDLHEGTLPNFGSGTETEFMTQVKDALGLFVSVTVASSSAGPPRTLRGKDAIGHQYGVVRTKVEASQTPSLADLKDLVLYGWMLTKEEQEEVTKWREAAIVAGGRCVTAAARGFASSSANLSGGNRAGMAKCRTSKAADLDQMTRRLFRRGAPSSRG